MKYQQISRKLHIIDRVCLIPKKRKVSACSCSLRIKEKRFQRLITAVIVITLDLSTFVSDTTNEVARGKVLGIISTTAASFRLDEPV